MPFLSLSLTNFRNLQNTTIDLSANEVFFVGENGQGKSNFLESLYYASYASSFRVRSDADVITYGEKNFSVRSLYKDENSRTHTVSVFFENDKKRIEKNGKKVSDRKELINTIPCVLFCHEDLDFVSGEPERRRFFIDQSLTMYDSLYVDVMRRYKKVLKTRNIILKDGRYDLLDVYNVQLVENGLEIQKKRNEVIYDFNQYFSDLYQKVTGIDNVRISYTPSWKSQNFEEIVSILKQKEEMDKQLGTTMSGPHRDHIRFMRNNKSFVPDASTGQRRLLSILLRVSQALFYINHTGKKPVFLMDDVLLELDPDKRQKVTALLPEYDQLFCTFLPGEPYERYKRTTTKVYEITNGTWNE